MIYEKVKALCESKNMTIMALESEAGIANGVIGGWRKSIPAIDTVAKVADVLGVTVDDLIDGVTFPERKKKDGD